jgi:hypothetical protein
MPGFITVRVCREGVHYLPFITANVANSVAEIVEDVQGLWAWRIAYFTVAPMVATVGFPNSAVPMTHISGKPAYLAGGIAFQTKAVWPLLKMPVAVRTGIPMPVAVRG